ncbi:Peroxisomal biogenesis factor 3 [Grifola frondosa]|uniref:Peroxisomal biogenesis factor 3 n=1 Tax=Grifola frondosa TaxID=5627 RepID=A0A1C7MKP5_GRIFR|nr:Peroxisomal biogenesis factor 3 [Grifola frondosa]
MLHALAKYFHERRRGLTRAASYVGGVYLIGRYVADRLEDVRNKVIQDRLARENLRRRFEQNQQDVAFTIMALLPTLGTHILQDMDVEGVTHELQSFSRASKTAMELQHFAPPSESGLSLSAKTSHSNEQDGRSENGSISVVSSVGQDDGTSIDLTASSTSWAVSSMQSSQPSEEPAVDPLHPAPPPSSRPPSPTLESTFPTQSCQPALYQAQPMEEQAIPVTRSKAELWKEVKILSERGSTLGARGITHHNVISPAFTRTLTVIYSITLLSIFTHIQLNILGRSKYIQSTIQLERDERMREQLQYNTSVYSLFWAWSGDTDDLEEAEAISEETERKYLTLSWWILHVGWKDVGERVRRGVEEVFEGFVFTIGGRCLRLILLPLSVSLKTKLTVADLHRLISDVRRRVEYEVTFEGQERRINFMSTLLPPTPETLQHVLTQGGIPARLANASDTKFESLLSETRTHLSSGSFERVLEVCLDQATDILFSGVEKHPLRGPSSVLGQEPRERLAGMLPGLARWCHLALEALPNELVDRLTISAGACEREGGVGILSYNLLKL